MEVADRLAIAAKFGIGGEKGWESLTQFADELITRTDLSFSSGWKFYRNKEFPAGEFRRYAKLANPKEIAVPRFKLDMENKLDNPMNPQWIAGRKLLREAGGKLLLRGEEISLTGRNLGVGGVINTMIAASGEVQISGAMLSVIIAGGDVTKIASLRNCILICDGDVEFLSGWNVKGLIVARGKVICKEGRFGNCLIRSGHTLTLPNGKSIDLKDGTPDPFAFVKFFELADVGLAAEALPLREKSDLEGVRLKDVGKESLFAAGLRRGDVITAIEEKKTPTTEIFRRVLRRKLAEGGPILTVTLRRSGKTLEVPFALKD